MRTDARLQCLQARIRQGGGKRLLAQPEIAQQKHCGGRAQQGIARHAERVLPGERLIQFSAQMINRQRHRANQQRRGDRPLPVGQLGQPRVEHEEQQQAGQQHRLQQGGSVHHAPENVRPRFRLPQRQHQRHGVDQQHGAQHYAEVAEIRQRVEAEILIYTSHLRHGIPPRTQIAGKL